MKHAILLSILAILLAMLLPMQAFSAPAPTTAVPSPSADRDMLLTVQTKDGIETTSMQSYLPGVLAGEMPALFEVQALMAQAVAARTYILHRMERTVTAHPDADICNDPACCKAYATEEALRENWGELYNDYYAKISAAASSTDGQYLTYEGEPIEAVFHSSSAGATESSAAIWNDRPYLVSVESPETAADVPAFVTEVSFSAARLKAKLLEREPSLQLSADPAAWLTDITRNDSGRVQSITIGGTPFSGTQLRGLLGLRSSAFTADYADGVFTFTVSGYGHGVGMSQYGANVYAKQGWDYAEILAHYYPNTQLVTYP